MPTIRAVLLDADGVVQLPVSAWRASLGALCGEPSRADEFLTDVFGAERPCLTGALDFEVALGQVLRKWESTVSVEAHRASFMTNSLGYRAYFDHLQYSCELRSCRLHGERFHLSEGAGRIHEILKGYGLDVPDQSARAFRRRVDD